MITFEHLNNLQAHGHACIVCGANFTLSGIHAAKVGRSATTGEDVFACEQVCAPAVGYIPPTGDEQLALAPDCGPACTAPSVGVHTSCPGPAAGAEVVSAR